MSTTDLWFLVIYLVGGLLYLLFVPRWAYRHPDLFLDWEVRKDLNPSVVAATWVVALSPLWIFELLRLLFQNCSLDFLFRALDRVALCVVWLVVPDHRNTKKHTPHATTEK